MSESVSLSQLAEVRGMEMALKTLVDATRCVVGIIVFCFLVLHWYSLRPGGFC